MDSIVEKLSAIESTAAAIVEYAEAQKPVIEKEIQAERDKFDRDLEADTNQRLASIRSDLKGQMEELLTKQQRQNRGAIERLVADFDQNYMRYAREILNRILEV